MATKATEFLTPIMRLVQGDCFEPQTKDLQTGLPLTVKRGPNAGQPTQKYFVAVAGKKGDPKVEQLRALFDQVARTDFPTLYPVPGGACVNPNFSSKIVDGDGMDQNGKPNSTKEGFAGHWVFRFASSFKPKCFAAGHYEPHEQMTDPKSIPRGHFVRVAGNVGGNGELSKPGLFVNQSMIEWAHVGDVITSGPDAGTVFGGGAAPAPAGGLQMLPAAGATTYAAYIAGGWTDAALIAQGYAVAAAVAPPPPPPPAVAPPPPPPPAVAPPPPPPPAPVAAYTAILAGGPIMLPAAGATTYAAYIAGGWTDAALIAQGYMAPPAAIVPLPPAGIAPPPPPPAPIAVAPAGKMMLPPAGATTYAQYISAGWTDAALIQNGFMAA